MLESSSPLEKCLTKQVSSQLALFSRNLSIRAAWLTPTPNQACVDCLWPLTPSKYVARPPQLHLASHCSAESDCSSYSSSRLAVSVAWLTQCMVPLNPSKYVDLSIHVCPFFLDYTHRQWKAVTSQLATSTSIYWQNTLHHNRIRTLAIDNTTAVLKAYSGLNRW